MAIYGAKLQHKKIDEMDSSSEDSDLIPMWEGYLLVRWRTEEWGRVPMEERCGIPRLGFYTELPTASSPATGLAFWREYRNDDPADEVVYLPIVPDGRALRALAKDFMSNRGKMTRGELAAFQTHRKFIDLLNKGDIAAYGCLWLIPHDGGHAIELGPRPIEPSFWTLTCEADYQRCEVYGADDGQITDRFGAIVPGRWGVTELQVSASALMERLWKKERAPDRVPISVIKNEDGSWQIDADGGAVQIEMPYGRVVDLGLHILHLLSIHRSIPVCLLLLEGLVERRHPRNGNRENGAEASYAAWLKERGNADALGLRLLQHDDLTVEAAHEQLGKLIVEGGLPPPPPAVGPYDRDCDWSRSVRNWDRYGLARNCVRKAVRAVMEMLENMSGDAALVGRRIAACIDFPEACMVLTDVPPKKRRGKKLVFRHNGRHE